MAKVNKSRPPQRGQQVARMLLDVTGEFTFAFMQWKANSKNRRSSDGISPDQMEPDGTEVQLLNRTKQNQRELIGTK